MLLIFQKTPMQVYGAWISTNYVYVQNQVTNLGDCSGPVFCLLLGVSSDYAQQITGQVAEVTCPVIGRAQPELTQSKRQKTGPGLPRRPALFTFSL